VAAVTERESSSTAPGEAEATVDSIAAVASLAEPTRRRLFDWVAEQPDAVGRDHAATALGVGRPLAAFHLDRLVEAGLLAVEYRRLSGRTGPGAGRPAKLYRPSNRAVEVSVPARRYEVAARLFAESLESIDGKPPAALVAAAARRGRRLAERVRRSLGRKPSVKRIRSALLAELEAGGYKPRPLADRTIRFANCPYDELVAEHHDLICGANVAMAAALVEGTGAQFNARLDPQPGWCCVVLEPDRAPAT
jgi:predicted ArsR family transcriptional regulator